MNTSEQVSELMAALSAAQGEMGGAVKDATNPHFRKQYSDLASVIAAIKGPFAKNGLCYIQGPGQMVDGVVIITTRIGHTSGQWVESSAHIPIGQKANAQTYGSAVTYGRRYGLQSLAGVPSVDDDGEAASATQAPEKPPALTDQQVAAVHGLIAKCPAGTIDRMVNGYGVADVGQLPAERYDSIMTRLRDIAAGESARNKADGEVVSPT